MERVREIDTRISDIRAGRELLAMMRKAFLAEEEKRVRVSVQDAVDAEYKKLGPALVQVFSSLRVLETLKNDLQARNFGFYSVPCKISTGNVFRESTFNRASDLAVLIRECATHGFVKLPSELS